MAQINLLPWREELRQEKKKEFLTQLLGVAIVAAIGGFLWIQSAQLAIESQLERNQMLKSEISLLQKQVDEIKELKAKRKELEDRMRVIQDLEGKRSIIVHYFDELTKATPDGVYMTYLERKGNTFYVKGVGDSNQRVSAFMRKLDESVWFTNVALKSVVADPALGGQSQRFDLEFTAESPTVDAGKGAK